MLFRRALWGGTQFFGLVLAVCVGIGWLIAFDHLRTALAATALLLAGLFTYRRGVLFGLLGVSLPFPMSVLGGKFNVAVSDLVLVVLAGLIIGDAWLDRSTHGAALSKHRMRPFFIVALPYSLWMAVVFSAHLDLDGAFQVIQRAELYILPVIVGFAAASGGRELPLLRAYVLGATALSAVYPFTVEESLGFGAEKNSSGQYMANALLLIMAIRGLRDRLAFLVPVLALGLLWTQSRGAILSVVFGLVVLVVVQPGRERGRTALLLLPVALAGFIAFNLLPDEAQERNTSFSTTDGSDAARSLEYREEFADQAWQMIHAEPVFGVGIGGYIDGIEGTAPPTSDDPHQILLLVAAEGGYPMLFGFIAMIVGTFCLCGRYRRRLYGPASAAVMAATVGHGLFDVYWVRGTPVLSWLLVGMVLGSAQLKRSGQSDQGLRRNLILDGPDRSASIAS